MSILEKTTQSILHLTSARLAVRNAADCITGLEAIMADEKTMELYPQFIHSPERCTEQFLALLEQHGIFVFPFADKQTNEIIGFITLNNVAEEELQIEIGYFLLSSHWGKGFAREIVAALLSHLRDLGWRRVMASLYSGNHASERLLKSFQFELVEIIKDKYTINGRTHDDIIYALGLA